MARQSAAGGTEASASPCIVVMGPSGCGKTRIGKAVARELRLRFVEGDQYHPPENVARMAAGIPLTDADRAGWLASLAAVLRDAAACGEGVVVSCSALKRGYRDTLRAGAPDTIFVYLRATPALLRERVQARRGHFMPASLIDSQWAALEEPSPEEHPVICRADAPVGRIIRTVHAAVRRRRPHPAAPDGDSGTA